MEAFAPAKVNLFLHVGAPGADGYHPVCSLMMFADVGDTVSIKVHGGLRFSVDGLFASGLGAGGDNLVIRARDALLSAVGGRGATPDLVLHKGLPIASGLGGGSSDAAATLRLIRDTLALNLDDGALAEIGRPMGADMAACLRARPVVGTGRGDVLSPPPPLPDLDVVLVNPARPSPTGAVYRAYDGAVAAQGANAPAWPSRFAGARDVAAFLATTRNDLQTPAAALEPTIGEVLGRLAAEPETLLARMSGSGATCFALCADRANAVALAKRLELDHPEWWVRACKLGGADHPSPTVTAGR
jgi:4-diphosphocytidyl-2-C-methyl-D-erythritol kinase